ncbi:MAG TPA: quinolinate synthase NadA [Gemmatales bacterium]|nr:quinolinate synthase NadA [Gemmatales bacterium]
MALELIDQPLPSQKTLDPSFQPYRSLSDLELRARCWAARKTLGDKCLILGHHYQQDEVIEFADLRGDSYKLASLAAQKSNCQYIVFCGVHFMAETADILAAEHVRVILPDLAAGCSMADMADIDMVEDCWDQLGDAVDTREVMPVTYINSAANLKAFCGSRGGLVCTSSNARAALEWSFAQRQKVLFFPDQHLGRNTARQMGVPLEQMIVWDPSKRMGGNTIDAVRQAKVLLWKGHCSVHQMFKPQHVDLFRKTHPGIKVLVHPECMMEVVDKADLVGSTEYILKTVAAAPPGSQWAIGTELHLVNRLKQEHPEQQIHFLSTMVCMCATMYRIDLPHLCWVLENLVAGKVVNEIVVPPTVAHDAKLALDRMLQVK